MIERCEILDFGSINFLLYFLPVFFILYLITPRYFKNVTLLAGSFIFYAQGEPKYLLVIPVSIYVNYIIGNLLDASVKRTELSGKSAVRAYGEKKNGQGEGTKESDEVMHRGSGGRELLFAGAIMTNLAVLCHFKLWAGAIPLGLSFYTFQVISYLVDVHYGEIRAERRLVRFATYLGMFPKIGSGPVVTYGSMRKALGSRTITGESVQDGLKYFVLGLAFKVLLADRIGILWAEVCKTGFESVTWRYAWLGAFAYSLNLYFDFHGYTMMAVGLGRMLGFELPDNFRTPYLSRSVKEFYRRWHVTMGLWFRKYVYIPLGGSRKGEGRTILNLLVVWLLTGFWHGVSANFFLWGVFLWLCIVLERFAERFSFVRKMKILPHLYLWFVIPISWMLFAITDVREIQTYLIRMFGIGNGVNIHPTDWLVCLKKHGAALIVAVVCCTGVVEWIFKKWKHRFIVNLLMAILFWLCVWKILASGSNPFQYLSY